MPQYSAITTSEYGRLAAPQASQLGVRQILLQLQEEGMRARTVRCMTLKEDDEFGNSSWFVFCAIAVGTADQGPEQVEAFIARIFDDPESRGNFTISVMHETMNPAQHKCPPNILEVLTPTDHSEAIVWRRQAANWAMRNCGYELAVAEQPSGSRSISVTVTHGLSSVVIARAQGLDCGTFGPLFETLSSAHIMSNIRCSRS